jgi:hypothetical protein
VIRDPVDIIYCEVCELPHRRGVAVCEECKHFLGTAPNWELLRLDVAVERNKAVIGLATMVAVGALMIGLFDRVWIVPVVALLAWSLNHGRRWRAIAKRLAKQAGPGLRG